MTFQEAVEEMKKLANGRVWSLVYEVASYHLPEIHGYISREENEVPHHATHSNTYAGAIENVRCMLGLTTCDLAPEEGEDAHENKICI